MRLLVGFVVAMTQFISTEGYIADDWSTELVTQLTDDNFYCSSEVTNYGPHKVRNISPYSGFRAADNDWNQWLVIDFGKTIYIQGTLIITDQT